MLALKRIDGIFYLGICSFFLIFKSDELVRYRQFVLILTGYAAGKAANTFLWFNNHGVTGHAYSPTFLTFTTTSMSKAVPEIGSIAKALNSFGFTPKPYDVSCHGETLP